MYKGFDGFAPNYAYLNTEDYIVHPELREVSTHVQKGTTFFTEENGYRSMDRVTEHWSDAKENIYLIPQVEVDHYWTSLDEPFSTIILLYHNHAICEHHHSDLKHDLDIAWLPSGKFSTNALILTLISLTYNLLRLIGQTCHGSSVTGYRPWLD